MMGAPERALDRRVHELDTISAVLAMERRDELAERKGSDDCFGGATCRVSISGP